MMPVTSVSHYYRSLSTGLIVAAITPAIKPPPNNVVIVAHCSDKKLVLNCSQSEPITSLCSDSSLPPTPPHCFVAVTEFRIGIGQQCKNEWRKTETERGRNS